MDMSMIIIFFSVALHCNRRGLHFYGHVAADGYVNVHLAFHSWERSMNNRHDAPTTSTILFSPMKLSFWRCPRRFIFFNPLYFDLCQVLLYKKSGLIEVNIKYLSLQVVFPKWKVVMTQTKGFWFIFYGLSNFCNLFNP